MTKYEELKEQYDKLNAKNDAAKAKLEVYNEVLKGLGYNDIEEAKKALVTLEAKIEKLNAKIEELTSDIEAALK